jgi:hypothetical protein
VILCNGTHEQALEMRKEVHDYLRDTLHLTLSLEKTKVTHLNEGFDFLGFHLKRGMCGSGMATRVTIPDKALAKHRATLLAALAPDTHEDSVRTKIMALNRVIGGWCRYYQYTSQVSTQFTRMEHEAFWLMAHWLGRKFKLKMPAVFKKYFAVRTKDERKTLGVDKIWLARHSSFKTRRYNVSPFKPNPYTTQDAIEREELLDEHPWLGTERRPGMEDLCPVVLERDGHKCVQCQAPVTVSFVHIDHKRPVSSFKKPVDANRLDNLQTLCVPCHKRKTEMDRQRESRVQ